MSGGLHADKPLRIAFLEEGLRDALYALPPRDRRTAVFAMHRRVGAGMQQLAVGSVDPDWKSWPAEGHRFLGQPVVFDDTLDKPQIRFEPYLGPPLPVIPPPEPPRRSWWRRALSALKRRTK